MIVIKSILNLFKRIVDVTEPFPMVSLPTCYCIDNKTPYDVQYDIIINDVKDQVYSKINQFPLFKEQCHKSKSIRVFFSEKHGENTHKSNINLLYEDGILYCYTLDKKAYHRSQKLNNILNI